jgi:acyl carrier protein
MSDLTSALLAFVRSDLLRNKDVAIDADTYLFEDGLVDSLGILTLIAFLELRIGRSIPDRDVVMENFRSVRAIDRRFGSAGVAGDGR